MGIFFSLFFNKYINGVFFCVQLLVFIAIFRGLFLFVSKKACRRMATTCLNNLDLKTTNIKLVVHSHLMLS
jgi:hypothetical protein